MHGRVGFFASEGAIAQAPPPAARGADAGELGPEAERRARRTLASAPPGQPPFSPASPLPLSSL